MKYPTTLIIAALFFRTAVAAPEPVTCDSPCDCHDAHGEGRWSVKTDASLPPTDASAIQAVTPSAMFGWPGPDAALTMQSERTGIENKWFALTGRVVELKVEEDGDLHIALHDVTSDKPGVVVCEVPAKPQWCEIHAGLRCLGNSSADGVAGRSVKRRYSLLSRRQERKTKLDRLPQRW